MMYPLRFEPIYQDYVWGGERIAKKYNRTVKGTRIAESWEISDRDEGMSIVANGPYKGRSLRNLTSELGEQLLGKGRPWKRFPLLLKIIDAKENLSIQVHPNEKTAPLLNGEPKTELWYILEEGTIYAGLKKGVNREALLKTPQVETLLEKHTLQKGDAFYIPGGRAHAICAGCMLFEVQQNSNTTYRLYDWGRKNRPLHIEEALTALDWTDQAQATRLPVNSPHFHVKRLYRPASLPPTPHTFQILFFLHGEGKIIVDGHAEQYQPGQTYLIPAAATSIALQGQCDALHITL